MVMVVAVGAAMSSCAGKPPAPVPMHTAPDHLVVLLAETKSISYFLEHDEVRIAFDCMRDNGSAALPSLPTRVTTISTRDALAMLSYEQPQAGESMTGTSPDYWGEITELIRDQSAEFKELVFGAGEQPWAEYDVGGHVLGVSDEGCMGTARAQLFGSMRNYLLVTYLPQIAEQEARAEADSTHEYRLGLATWTAEHRALIDEAHETATTACHRERKFGCQRDQKILSYGR